MSAQRDNADFLYGMEAVAAYLGITPRQGFYMADKGGLPTFKIGQKVCARRTTIDTWLVEREAANGKRS